MLQRTKEADVAPLQYGKANEGIAREAYRAHMVEHHKDFKIYEAGLVIDPQVCSYNIHTFCLTYRYYTAIGH